MCKGAELSAYIEKKGGWEALDKVVYVGDGGNDFCPLVRMRDGDWGLVRKGMELDERIAREGKESGVKVDVKKWEQAWQIEE